MMEKQRRNSKIISKTEGMAQDIHQALQPHYEYIVKRLEGSNEPSSSYIGNPNSCYYYQGHNPFKLLAKTLLLLEHHITTLEQETDNKELIAHNRQLAKEKYQITRKDGQKTQQNEDGI